MTELCKCSKCGSTKLLETYFSKNVKGQYFKTCDKCRDKSRGKKHNIEECKEFAIHEGGQCLSTEYKTNKIKLKWMCCDGHEWEANYGNILKGHWCPLCHGTILKTLDQCKEFAKSKEGECLSTEYKNSKSNLTWKCKENHEWEANYNSVVINNTWCKICAYKILNKNMCLSIEECKEFAKSKGGECLSTEYKNSKSILTWRCKENHEWDAHFNAIKTCKIWCNVCSGTERICLKECQNYAISKGGECLSTEYIPSSKTQWRCKNNHEWSVSFYPMKHCNTWCSKCNKTTIEQCRELAEAKGGECLSINYVSAHEKMKWKCRKGHEWDTAFNHIKNDGTWCPSCSSYRSESVARQILVDETGYQWVKIRPKWLKGLELDGYCKELNIAYEYQGSQHFKYIPFFHRNGVIDFHNQQKRDRAKVRRASRRGVRIIFIHHQYTYNKPDLMRAFIQKELQLQSDSD
jgi:hypothetical protein